MLEDKRFWSRTTPNGKCIEYKHSLDKWGYGCLSRRKIFGVKNLRAHRYSWYLKTGKYPADLCVLHKCDNPACVNQEHLFLGTHRDNSDDKMRKGRDRYGDQRGSKNPNSKLTEKDVGEIKEMIKAGIYNTAIAAQYGVSHQSISHIRRGDNWIK